MTLSRYHLVLLALLVIIGGGVGIAWYYVENVYREREKETDLIKQGRTEELIVKSPPKPPGPPPLERSTSRGVEVLALFEQSDIDSSTTHSSKQVVSIRGNGEFVRLPARADEPGPVVTGMLDRARVDDLIRSALEPPKPGTQQVPGYTFSRGASKQSPLTDHVKIVEIREVTGRELNRSAVPERVTLKLVPAEAGTAPPWPFQRQKPEAFSEGAALLPESDRARFREGVLKLFKKDAQFSFKDKVWRVESVGFSLSP